MRLPGIVLFCLLPCLAFGQVSVTGKNAAWQPRLLQIKALADSARQTAPRENIYLQFDKPYYAVGDTIWFKGYLLKSSFLTPSGKSAILNVDIENDSSKIVNQYRFPVRAALCRGNITLDEKGFPPGSYTIRAYTNWMRNFSDRYFFMKHLEVSSTQHLLAKVAVATTGGKVDVSVRLTGMDNLPYAARQVSVQIIDKGRTLSSQKLLTGVDGAIKVDFAVPPAPDRLEIVVFSDKKIPRANIPLALNRPENADVQFLPEGGKLVAGLPAHVGFKALGEDGKWLDISGTIVNSAQTPVASFRSLHNGMGSFDLDVKPGEAYTARVNLQGGVTHDVKLPAVEQSGTVLHVGNNPADDSLEVIASATMDVTRNYQTFFVVGMSRGVLCYATAVIPETGKAISLHIAKSLFPTGVLHLLLTTTDYKPVNERLVFIDHHDALNVSFSTDKAIYHPRDSVGLKLKVTDKDGNPVSGSFSMGVTDDPLVRPDTGSENILTRFLLTTDLKGYVESPWYYFSEKAGDRAAALDNLLLTQGWTGYDWSQVFNPPPLSFQPETDLAVTGYVRNVFNKPVKGTDVLLFSKKPAILMDTTTDANGGFVFDRLPMIDTPIFNLKAVNKGGKSFNVGIEINDPPPPAFASIEGPLQMPWYVTDDTMVARFVKNQALSQQPQYNPTGHMLKEVNIKDKKIIKDSQNPNGPGNADVVIDEKELEKAGRKTWLDLLREKVPGFKEGFMPLSGSPDFKKIRDDRIFAAFIIDDITKINYGGTDQPWYYIDGKPVKFYIDGISLYQVMPISYPAIDNINDYLNSHSAEDVKGIEINSSSKYAARYVPIEWGMIMSQSDMAFVEITTRSGNGPGVKNTPGTYLYKPLPMSRAAQFYKPKYTVKGPEKDLPDLRSTIDWEPDIVTDANGEAKVWFYTGGNASTYSIIVEGVDLRGGLGRGCKTLVVEK